MNKALEAWVAEFTGAVTICDVDGVILAMNEKAIKTFEKDGGAALIGTNLIDCHPEPSRSKVKRMLVTRESNSYTIEKNGTKKLIYQQPWYEEGEYRGLVELSLEIPQEMPHFVRNPS